MRVIRNETNIDKNGVYNKKIRDHLPCFIRRGRHTHFHAWSFCYLRRRSTTHPVSSVLPVKPTATLSARPVTSPSPFPLRCHANGRNLFPPPI